MTELSSRYDPHAVEQKWYQYWRQGRYFEPSQLPDKKSFTIVMPPPNVTGVLHVGHALNTTWQDILIRFHRMLGDNTLWLPGTDHAGIHTQMKVDEMLRSQGHDRREMGREQFVQQVWQWKDKYGGEILWQIERLGASVDWSRLRFTMDPGLSEAVTEVFVRLYEEGLLYRGHYITNWCVSCLTALSDIEVDHVDEPGTLTYIRYPLANGEGSITVATTRPETMLGDTAVAVHPNDERWKAYVGEMVRLPLMNRLIPVVADEYVDPEYGTGAVKVTPAHDPNDFAIGDRHRLERLKVIGDDGRMTEKSGAYQGLDRYQARKQVADDLNALGLVVKVENITHSVGHCEKCGTAIEPLLSLQWFVRIAPLAEPAIEAVRSGAIEFVPPRFEKIYMNWMNNIRDWCVSRQIWWGHRIPAYYCDDCDNVLVSRVPPESCSRCGGTVHQDDDVLDTWFSSALWPFSTLGWPHQTEDLATFYPTSVLSTAYDIIFFWVSRMIMQGVHFTGQVPFGTVLMHGLVRDEQGRKMSKSLGNGVDPMDVIDKYGADALRIALVLSSAPGNDQRYSAERVEAGSHFANKIYNATRFVLMNLDKGVMASNDTPSNHLADRWIRYRLNIATKDITAYLENFDFGQAARVIYDFLWDDYCDWYIELAKVRLKSSSDAERATVLRTLVDVVSDALKLLHPFMPFVTEELWHALPHRGDSIMVTSWPGEQPIEFSGDDQKQFQTLQDLIRGIRNLRAELTLPPSKRADVGIWVDDHSSVAQLQTVQEEIRELGRISHLTILARTDEGISKPSHAISQVAAGATIYVPLEGLVDIDKENRRLSKLVETTRTELDRVRRQLADPNFCQRAPEVVVEKARTAEKDLEIRLARLQERLEDLA
ncbi:MAG: valine--tRNA ligase [Firmicutes bacterium]|nr:valine--tRNA ligase [Bacillota bacterium]